MNLTPATLLAGQERDGLVLRSHWEPGGEVWLEIVHAAPRALFSGPLLRRVRLGEAFPFTEVDKVDVGGVIRIRARADREEARTLVYRITEQLDHDVWVGTWPD